MERLCGSPDHQGVVAEVDPYPYGDALGMLRERVPVCALGTVGGEGLTITDAVAGTAMVAVGLADLRQAHPPVVPCVLLYCSRW